MDIERDMINITHSEFIVNFFGYLEDQVNLLKTIQVQGDPELIVKRYEILKFSNNRKNNVVTLFSNLRSSNVISAIFKVL